MKPFGIDDLLACVARYVHLPRSGTQRLLTAPSLVQQQPLVLSRKYMR